MDSVRVEQLEREGRVSINWLPFELHPNVPPEGIPREQYFGRGRSEQVHAHLRAVAAEVGLTVEPRDVLINSRRALGAAEFAREQGRFEAMHRALFEAHWHQTARLEEIEDLKRVGAAVGLDPEELGRALEEGRYEALLDENRRQAEAAGINAIPAHIFGRRYLVVGAHPYELFRQVLDRLQEDAAEGEARPE